MKKILLSLFACLLFLFSCNLNTSVRGTDLVVLLPGGGTKLAQYDEEDVVSYLVDLTRDDGVNYSETGEAGGTIVFNDILSGTYTVDIYALDGDTVTAARGRETIEVFENEENHFIAEAILGTKVTDFFVSVPNGAWINKNKVKSYFREMNSYVAVRDVEYGAFEEEGVQGGPSVVTWAEIINPDIDYAYLNMFMDEDIGWQSVSQNESFTLEFMFRTENKAEISVTVTDSLKEDYGVTRFFECEQGSYLSEQGSYSRARVYLYAREKGINPLIRIGFPKDCGKIYVRDMRLESSWDNKGLDNSVIPVDKNLVTMEYNTFTFSKSKAGSIYTAGLFTGMQIEKDKLYKVTISSLQSDVDVSNVRISGKSFASKKEIFTSATESLSLTAENPVDVSLLIPGSLVYSDDDYEGAYIEIAPGEYDGDEITLSASSVSCEIASDEGLTCRNGYTRNYRVLLAGFEDYPCVNTNSVPKYMGGSDGIAERVVMLNPGETKYFNVEVIPAVETDVNPDHDDKGEMPAFYYTTLKPGALLKDCNAGDRYYIPLMIDKYLGNTCKDLVCKKLDDGRFEVKSLSPYEKFIKISAGVNGVYVADGLTFLEESEDSYNLGFEHKYIENVETSGKRCKAKIISFPGEFFVKEKDSSFSKIRIGKSDFLPVLGAVDNPVVFSLNDSPARVCGNPKFCVEIKSKDGDLICSGEISELEYNYEENFDYRFIKDSNSLINKVKQTYNYKDSDYYTLECPFGQFNRDDLVVNVYFTYDSTIKGTDGLDHNVTNEPLDVYLFEMDIKYE